MKHYPLQSINLNRTKNHWNLISLFVCLFMLFTNQGMAQESAIYKLTEDKAEMKSKLAEQNVDFDKLHSLIYDLQPTVYVQDQNIELTAGETPYVLRIEDIKSFNIIGSSNESFNKVELLVIRLNTATEINETLDFSIINGFDSLKYILVECNFSSTEQEIRNFISNSNPKATIFFFESIEQ